MLNTLPMKIFVAALAFSTTAFAQYTGLGTDSVSVETLKKYAPPALNPIMTNKLKKMFDITSPGMGMLSPDKKTLYFTWRVTGISQVWKIDGPKSFPIQLTSGSDAVNIADISHDGKFLIISKDLNGEENPGLFKLDLKTGLIEELFRKKKVQAHYSFMTQDSKSIFFTANDKNADSYSIYKMKLEDKSVETIYDGQGYWYVADEDQDGGRLILAKQVGSVQNEFYDYNVKTKELKPIIGQNEKEEYDVSFSAQKDQYLVSTNKLGDFKKLYTLKAGNLKPFTEDIKHDVSSFSIDQAKKRIIYTINRGGYTDLKAVDAKTYKAIAIPKFPGADHVFAGKTTRDGRVTMLGIITAKAPRLGYSFDWETKKLTQWVLPSAPEVDLSKFSNSELMTYETRDNVKIPMFVRFPEGCKPMPALKTPCPVVVHFHGGPEGQSDAGFSPMAQAFVNEGFIFVEPNVRGSDGYGKTWLNMDNGPLRENVIGDVEDAAIWSR